MEPMFGTGVAVSGFGNHQQADYCQISEKVAKSDSLATLIGSYPIYLWHWSCDSMITTHGLFDKERFYV